VNLLTEDNLPYYSHTILNRTNKSSALTEWGHVWTAEEARHSEVIREWVHVTRAIDPQLLETGRMTQMTKAEVPEPPNLPELLTYTSFQELATNIAHRNTSIALDKERWGKKVMGAVAGDEMKHHIFYSELATAAILIDPSAMVIAIFKQLKGFKMPGTGIPDFERHSKLIAEAGIYDGTQFLNLVVIPTLNKWDIDSIEGLSKEAEKAREDIHRYVRLLGRASLIQQQRIADATQVK
jgi:acyl-[acyl-carrier-protein] desaturase